MTVEGGTEEVTRFFASHILLGGARLFSRVRPDTGPMRDEEEAGCNDPPTSPSPLQYQGPADVPRPTVFLVTK